MGLKIFKIGSWGLSFIRLSKSIFEILSLHFTVFQFVADAFNDHNDFHALVCPILVK